MRRLACASLLAAALLAAPAAAATRAVEVPVRTVRADGVTLGYRAFGSGSPVVFITGLDGTMESWDPPILDAVAAHGHRVVIFDNEGVGRSGLRPGTLTIRRMGDDTAALVHALHLRRPDVVAWSMGAMIAQSLAVRHPAALRRLALLAGASGDGHVVPPRADVLAAVGSLNGAAPDVSAVLALLFPPNQKPALDRYVAHLSRWPPFTLPSAGVFTSQLAASIQWTSGADPDGRRVAQLKMPVFVGGGVEDPLLPVGNQRHLYHLLDKARRRTLITYPGASHGFFIQNERDFVPRLLRFLSPGARSPGS